MTRKATIVSGGLIWDGWVARLMLNGWDVSVFALDQRSEHKTDAVFENTRRALPPEGAIMFCDDIGETLINRSWVQESVPKRLDLKHKVHSVITKQTTREAIVGSSTLGFKQPDLIADRTRIIVSLPLNPVRLSPLVEDAQTCAKTSDVFRNIGVLPLTLRKEIDAPIADRIREAIWREGLRLIKDGFCTSEEPDEDIRMGFGLRRAYRRLFETDRIADAESGMKHFLSRLGSAAKWPWSKLMDMPEFTEDLVNLISGQSDTPLGHLSIRDMERLRDDNLVGRKRKLQQTGTGAGAVIDAQEKQLPEPFQYLGKEGITMHRYVPQSRTDCNRHLNKAHYVEASAQATDRFMEMFVCNAKYIAACGSYFTIENRLQFLDDMFEGHLLTVATRLSSGQGKKLHLFHLVKSETGTVCASVKTYLVHIDLTTRRASEPVGGIQVRIEEIQADHSNLPKPETLGRASRGASPQRDPVP